MKNQSPHGSLKFEEDQYQGKSLVYIPPQIKSQQQQQQQSENSQCPRKNSSVVREKITEEIFEEKKIINNLPIMTRMVDEDELVQYKTKYLNHKQGKVPWSVVRKNKGSLSEAIAQMVPAVYQDQKEDVQEQLKIKMILSKSSKSPSIFEVNYILYQTIFLIKKHHILVQDYGIEASATNLNTIIDMFEEKFRRTRSQIIEDLQSINGNIGNLFLLYQRPQEHQQLQWSQEDDAAVQSCKHLDDPSFQILLRYKGAEAIKERVKFINLSLPFNF